jgi:5'-3' exonuclease
MAILIDLNQVVISGLQSQIRANRINVLNKDLCRHLVLNSIRAIVHKFKRDYGNVIICCDSRKYWRKEVFPFYKASRKKMREKSDMDWDMVFEILDEVRTDLKNIFPYKLIIVDRAEADDVIGTLVPRLAAHEAVLIASSDGDFKQLHKYGNVKQYNPMLGIYVTSANPELELKEKILTGDSGDGIPSILNNDNVFVEGIRQKPLSAKKKALLVTEDFNDPDIEYYRNIQRNKLLIDLTMTPQEIKDKIIEELETEQTGSKQLVMKYFIEKRLNRLLECIDEF